MWLLDHLAQAAGLLQTKVDLTEALWAMYASLMQQGEDQLTQNVIHYWVKFMRLSVGHMHQDLAQRIIS